MHSTWNLRCCDAAFASEGVVFAPAPEHSGASGSEKEEEENRFAPVAARQHPERISRLVRAQAHRALRPAAPCGGGLSPAMFAGQPGPLQQGSERARKAKETRGAAEQSISSRRHPRTPPELKQLADDLPSLQRQRRPGPRAPPPGGRPRPWAVRGGGRLRPRAPAHGRCWLLLRLLRPALRKHPRLSAAREYEKHQRAVVRTCEAHSLGAGG